MAIGFARSGYVKRSDGKNVCCKAAYNGRMRIHFEGHSFQPAHTWNWSNKEPAVFHEVILPSHADPSLKDPEKLWNLVEKTERRKNSQVAIEMVIALPDDKALTVEDRIHLAKAFVEEHFVKHGLIVQLDVHGPEKKVATVNGKTELLDHNWHAHVLATTRRFSPDGKTFASHKARDLMPEIRNGLVISGNDWGKMWTQHQNEYFKEKGLELRVDPIAVVPQKHLGPVRMRGKRAFELMREHAVRVEINQFESQDPAKILEKLTKHQSHFSRETVHRFLEKFVSPEDKPAVSRAFWSQSALVWLYPSQTDLSQEIGRDKDVKSSQARYTSTTVLAEEKQALRLAQRIAARRAHKISTSQALSSQGKSLTGEQKEAFKGILEGSRLACIEGYAGTGKSYLLKALYETYTEKGYVVRALGPDSATSVVLQEKGLHNTENVYRFLFAHRHEKRSVQMGKEVWVLDEAGKLGNRPFLELLKLAEKRHVQLILSGSSKQLSPVERGNLFTAFTKCFGAHLLENIQRQKEAQQKAIAVQIARGEIGGAIDELVRIGGFQWSDTKEVAMEELVTQWALDRQTHPKQSSLIIAHSNAEVIALNEMVREVRRAWGDLHEEEYECRIASGRFYVSVGDKIEFRRNDNALEVTNGLTGTLIDASSKRFVVLVREKQSAREIIFDPGQFSSFRLGYASTFNRAQGGTVDRTYVLHSPAMNRPLFYVGLTRHTRNAICYVSHQSASCLTALKHQLYRDVSREITLDFQASSDMESQKLAQVEADYLIKLRRADSLVTKVQGYGLTAWRAVATRAAHIREHFGDTRADSQFYRFTKDELEGHPTKVNRLDPTQGNEAIEHARLFDEATYAYQVVSTKVSRAITCYPSYQVHSPVQTHSAASNCSFSRLSDAIRSKLVLYYSRCNEVSALATAYEPTKNGLHNLKQMRRQRNELAHSIIKEFSLKELKTGVSPKSLEIMQEQAARYESMVDASKGSLKELQGKLTDNVESLLYRLFPDGPSWKDRTTMRFGDKGSLAVKCGGDKAGTYYDFENKEGGGLVKLIKRELGLDTEEAKRWAQDFLGEAPKIEIPKQFAFRGRGQEQESDWVAIQPPAGASAPPLSVVSKGIDRQHNEVARYAYRDADGNLLFYTLRLVRKDDPTRKMVIPLSYGHREGEDGKAYWRLKGIQGTRPLYNLHLLKEYPNAPVVVVEGEKSAEQAGKLLPDGRICLTWCGGASAVGKTDWSPLYRRDVTIWPDNDKVGYRAGDEVCSQLRRIGAGSVKMVDREALKKQFPEKWDLADSLPEGISEKRIQRLMLFAEEKSVSVEALMLKLPQRELNEAERFVDKLWCQEVLWRVEERLRPELEKGDANPQEIRRSILLEAQQVIEKRQSMEAALAKQPGMDASMAKALSYQGMLYAAEHGREPSDVRIEEMRMAKAARDMEPVKEQRLTPIEEFGRALAESECSLVARAAQDQRVAEISKQTEYKLEVDRALSLMMERQRESHIELER